MILVLLSAVVHFMGMRTVVIFRILAAVALAAIALIVLVKPYLPTLPFKTGNTIETGGLLGKVEATTFLNTRMKTFDGKTVFIPNKKILNDYLINYHITPNRRVTIKVTIGYGDDLLKAKQILMDLLKEDERIVQKPAPSVYVTELDENGVRLSGRGWVPNLKYWKTRCEILEKLKLAYDREGITIAYPQRDVHLYQRQDSNPSKG
jgi:small conductance mechanosensitive channel